MKHEEHTAQDAFGKEGVTKRNFIKSMGTGMAEVGSETAYEAWDSVRAIQVDYEVLPFVADERKALGPGTPGISPSPVQLSPSSLKRTGSPRRGYSSGAQLQNVAMRATGRDHCLQKARFQSDQGSCRQIGKKHSAHAAKRLQNPDLRRSDGGTASCHPPGRNLQRASLRNFPGNKGQRLMAEITEPTAISDAISWDLDVPCCKIATSRYIQVAAALWVRFSYPIRRRKCCRDWNPDLPFAKVHETSFFHGSPRCRFGAP